MPLEQYRMVAAMMSAGYDRRAVLFSLLVSGQADLVTGGIDAGRFLGEHVLPCIHRFGNVLRAEPGRGGEQNDIDFGIVQNTAIGVDPTVHLAIGNIDFPFVTTAHTFTQWLQLGGIQIGNRGQLDVLIDGQRIIDGSAAAAAGADDADANRLRIILGRLGASQNPSRCHRGRTGGEGRARFQEVASWKLGRVGILVH